jgi:thiamine-phosphate pyrophosphorylase
LQIYALIDKQALNGFKIELKLFIEYLNSLNIPIAQYRNKILNKEEIKTDLELINSQFNGKLIINDYLEFINLADGLHVGQEDLAKISPNFQDGVKLLRDKIDNKILGLSTHNLQEIQEANKLNLDYIGLGAYRATTTKDGVQIQGKKLLEIAKKSKHKVALIGGLKISDTFDKNSNISYKVIGSDLMREFLK